MQLTVLYHYTQINMQNNQSQLGNQPWYDYKMIDTGMSPRLLQLVQSIGIFPTQICCFYLQ